MKINISKKAIENIPQLSNSLNQEYNIGELKSKLLQSEKYFVLLASRKNASPLIKGNYTSDKNPKAIIKLKMALNIIDQTTGNSFDLSILLPPSDGIFDDNLETAINEFQQFAGITVNGKVDRETILKIDSFLIGNEKAVFDHLSNNLIGLATGSSPKIKAANSFSEENGILSYKIELFVGDMNQSIVVESEYAFDIKMFENSNGVIELDGFAPVELDKKTQDEFNKKITEFENFNIDGYYFAKVKLDDIKPVLQNEQNQIYLGAAFSYDIQNTLDLPPTNFVDDGEKIYIVQPNDTFTSIVLNNYYDNSSCVIKNPYDVGLPIIYTFPPREALPGNQRQYDDRFQFYMNLLYYYNSTENQEWGIVKGQYYHRYSLNHLEDVNVFDNKFVYNDPDTHTGLPNYYRFLQEMEALNSGSKIEFDSQGNTSSFTVIQGKKIRIPSRQFADTLFCFLNFRQEEMMEIKIDNTDPDNPREYYDYITPAQLTTVVNEMTATSIINSILNTVIEFGDRLLDLYSETLELFRKAYDFVKNTLASIIPRGVGGEFGADVGITWGYPIATDIYMEQRLWRKMTSIDEFTLIFRQEGGIAVGFDTAVGASLGTYHGHGSTKRGVGLKVGAGLSSKLNVKGVFEYEFPIRREETALLSMAITVFGGTFVKSIAEAVDYFAHVNIAPSHYLRKTTLGIENKTEGWAQAQLGLADDNTKNLTIDQQPNQSATVSNKSFTSLENIVNNIPSIAIGGNASFSLGVEFSIENEYNNRPLRQNLNARVPSDTKVEMTFSTQAVVDFSVESLGTLIQNLFVSSTGIPAAIQSIFNSLFGLNRGILIGVVFEGKRLCEVENLTLADFSINSVANPTLTTNSQDKLQYGTGGNYVWTSALKLGTFTGSPDTFCAEGSQTNIYLNLTRIKQIWDNSSSFTFDLNTTTGIPSIFKSFEYGYALGYLYNSRAKKGISLADQVVKNFTIQNTNINVVTGYEFGAKRDILKAINQNSFGLDAAMVLRLKINLNIQDIVLILKFAFKVLKFATNFDYNDKDRREFYKAIDDQKIRINSAIIKLDPDTQQLDGKQYFEWMFGEGNVPTNDNPDFPFPPGYNSQVKGLNKFLDDYVVAGKPNPNLIGTSSFQNKVVEFVKGYEIFNKFYRDIPLTKEEVKKYSIYEITESLAYLAEILSLDFGFEAKIAASLGFEAMVGDAAKARLALAGSVGLVDNMELFKDGKATAFPFTIDPLYHGIANSRSGILQAIEDKNKVNDVKSTIMRNNIK